MKDYSNENVKFHHLEKSIEESVSIFKIVGEADKQNGGPQKHCPLKKGNPTSRSNKEQGVYQDTKIRKGGKCHQISIGVEAREEACG